VGGRTERYYHSDEAKSQGSLETVGKDLWTRQKAIITGSEHVKLDKMRVIYRASKNNGIMANART